MYPLVMCSLIALGVMIAKTWTLYVAHKNTRKVLLEVEEFAEEGRITEALGIAAAPIEAIVAVPTIINCWAIDKSTM